MSKKIITLVILLIAIALAGFVYLQWGSIYGGILTQHNYSTDWPIFHNDEYEYSIKYPTNWNVNDNYKDYVSFAKLPTNRTLTEADLMAMGYEIVVAVSPNNPEKLLIEQWINKQNWTKTRDNYREENFKVGDFDGFKVCDFRMDFPGCSIFITTNGKIYSFQLLYYDENLKEEADDIFERMVSTFKFTK